MTTENKELKRWDHYVDGDGGPSKMVQDVYGDYVLYDDVKDCLSRASELELLQRSRDTIAHVLNLVQEDSTHNLCEDYLGEFLAKLTAALEER